ncbi:MAG: hypothetical protein ACYS83_08130 [Planctomycetota bacterium]|jgi:hypothetical protein
MPAARRNQSNTMLYTLVAFVGLFIAAATVAVIYYIKFEDQRTIAQRSKTELGEMVTNTQWLNRGSIVGTKKTRETYLGKMVDCLDEVVSLIVGGPLKQTSAEVKANDANRQVKETLALLAQEHTDFENVDPNTTGLIRIIKDLKRMLNDTAEAALALNEMHEQLQKKYDREMAIRFESEQELSAKISEYKQLAEGTKRRYDELEAFMRQSTDKRAQTLMTQRDEAITKQKTTHDDLLRTRAQMGTIQDKMKRTQEDLWKIKPPPNMEVAAFKPDGTVMLVGNQVVHLNIGTDDHVYPGLTFSVYDKSMPIPEDGRGKAEIEVFEVLKNVALARITRSEKRRPIIAGDIVANLIWDSDKTNLFAVVGDFDLNNDGHIDYDGTVKIKELVEKPIPFPSTPTFSFLADHHSFSESQPQNKLP